MDGWRRASQGHVAVLLTLLVLAASGTPAVAGPADVVVTQRAPDIGVLPQEVTGIADVVCPGSGVCVGTGSNDEGLDYFMGAGDGGRTWAAYPLPGSTGTESYVLGMDCLSSSFCYAWGGTSGATVWWTSTPGQGGWHAKVFPGAIGADTMTCGSPGTCVAVTTVGGDVETSTGTAWSTADIGGGGWTAQPLDLAYRVFGVECPSTSTCVAWGQGATSPGDFQVDPTLWTTSAAIGGAWSRVLPVATGSGYSYNIKSVECPAISLCVANGVSSWTSGATSQFYSGYWVTTTPSSPVSDGWEWHQGEGSPFERGPLSCLSPTVCLSWDGARTMGSAPDPTDWEAPVPLSLPGENYLRLGGFGCFAAERCFAWGTDSGSASAGPLMRTRLWRGSSLGGAWSVLPLPSPPGHEDLVPHAQVSCNATSCTAVGVLRSTGYDTLGPVVWVSDTDGAWRLTAASVAVYPELATTLSSSSVRTTVSLAGRPGAGRPTRLVGKVTAARGCARARDVTLVGRNGRAAKRVVTSRRGRFVIRLTDRVRSRLAPKARVKVSRTTRGGISCLAARSVKVRVR